MRVLHFFKTYLPDTTGGIEQVIYQLCEGTREQGVESKVLTLSPNPRPATVQVARHQVVRARQDLYVASTGFSAQAFGLFRQLASEADLIHFHFPWPAMDLVHLCTRHGKPTVLSYHSDIVKQRGLLALYRPLMSRFLDSMDRIIVASPNYQQTSSTLRRYEAKTRVVPFGLDPSSYPSPTSELADRWRHRLPERFFVFVGVLRYYKGLDTLLEALAGTPYQVVIVGSGPEEDRLKAKAGRLGLQGAHFLGRLDDADKACLIDMSLGMVFPSHLRSEAFGISLLEASMYGKPMITCEIGTGTTYVNEGNRTGLVIPPDDPKALRAAMHQLWEQPALAHRMGVAARQRFETLFTAERMCRETVSIYRELIAG